MPKKITEDQIESYMQTLIDTPGRLAALTEGMTEEQLSAAPAPGEWSLAEILAHLRGCADVWGYSIYAMFILDNPELADIHARTWAQKMGYAKLTFAENFTAFQVGRENLARILAGLSFEQWGRTSRFSGKVNTHTIFSQTMRMALHERDHLQQIETMLSSDEVKGEDYVSCHMD